MTHINSTLEPQWNQFWKFLGGCFSNRYRIKGGSKHIRLRVWPLGARACPSHGPLLRALAPWLGGPFGLVWGLMVVPVMGALFQSRGWLPRVEAPPWILQAPTSILAMELLNAFKCNLKELTTKSAFSD